ncbi:hypothetical protein VCR6J2_230592 [Vibrio coralliirubri]|nr:hypothetical protein VCR6J2_230592 [Vibrio coralliirubri]
MGYFVSVYPLASNTDALVPAYTPKLDRQAIVQINIFFNALSLNRLDL